MKLNISRLTAPLSILASLLPLACGGGSSQTGPIAPALVMSSADLFAAITAGSQADHAARIAATGRLSFHDYYEQLHATVSDAPTQIDGLILSGARSRLEASQGGFMLLNALYPSLADFWAESAYNPEAATLASFQAGIKAVAQEPTTGLSLTAMASTFFPVGQTGATGTSSGLSWPSLFNGNNIIPMTTFSDPAAKQECDTAGLKSRLRTHLNPDEVASALTISQKKNKPADLAGMNVQTYTATLNLRNMDYLKDCFQTKKGRPIDPYQGPFTNRTFDQWLSGAVVSD